jgi:predicted acylesterase/phospholipase RssA
LPGAGELATALVLGGGGSKGSFESGALCFLKTQLNDLNISQVCGSSTGALNALALSTGIINGTDLILELYLGLQTSASMYRYSEVFRSVDELLQLGFETSLEALLRGGTQDLSGSYLQYDQWYTRLGTYGLPVMVPTIGGLIDAYILWRVVDEVELKIAYLQMIHGVLNKATSVYVLEPIEKVLNANIDFAAVGTLPLRMAVVGLETGELAYIDENGDLLIGAASENASDFREKWIIEGSRQAKLVNGCLASASIPGAFPARQLRANPWQLMHCVDGGVREMAPLHAAKQLGAKRVIAILASPITVESISIPNRPTMGPAVARSVEILTSEVAREEHSPSAGWCDDVEMSPNVQMRPLRNV